MQTCDFITERNEEFVRISDIKFCSRIGFAPV